MSWFFYLNTKVSHSTFYPSNTGRILRESVEILKKKVLTALIPGKDQVKVDQFFGT
jgi:hypothetical protein